MVCFPRLECLQLHANRLTTLPAGLINLSCLTELTLKDNPLVVRFVRDMSFQPSSLLELSARNLAVNKTPIFPGDIPQTLFQYLSSSHRCRNPKCEGVYFNSRVEHVKFVDFCGKYRIPLMQYLCSPQCSGDRPAVRSSNPNFESRKMKKVLLG